MKESPCRAAGQIQELDGERLDCCRLHNQIWHCTLYKPWDTSALAALAWFVIAIMITAHANACYLQGLYSLGHLAIAWGDGDDLQATERSSSVTTRCTYTRRTHLNAHCLS
jgi:hypothetical protein